MTSVPRTATDTTDPPGSDLERIATQRLWASVGLAVVVLHGLPQALSVLVLAFFIATSPYYPATLVQHLAETWEAQRDPGPSAPGTPLPPLPPTERLPELWHRAAHRLGRRFGTWR